MSNDKRLGDKVLSFQGTSTVTPIPLTRPHLTITPLWVHTNINPLTRPEFSGSNHLSIFRSMGQIPSLQQRIFHIQSLTEATGKPVYIISYKPIWKGYNTTWFQPYDNLKRTAMVKDQGLRETQGRINRQRTENSPGQWTCLWHCDAELICQTRELSQKSLVNHGSG